MKHNILKSPIDKRDISADLIYNKLDYPEKLDLSQYLNPARDQGDIGTCAAISASTMKEYQEFKEIGFDKYFSPKFIYNNRFDQNNDGMYARGVMKILHKIGIIEESKYPYNLEQKKDEIPLSLIKRASVYKIKAYGQIYTMNSLKASLYKNGPCLISFPTFNESERMWIKNDGDKDLGGHAMTVVGYNEKGFIIRNSWGNNWGNKGNCIYPYSDWGNHWEIWATIDDVSADSYFDEIVEKKKYNNFSDMEKLKKLLIILISGYFLSKDL